MANSIIKELNEVIQTNLKKMSKKFAEFLVRLYINFYVDKNHQKVKISNDKFGSLMFFAWFGSSIFFLIISTLKMVGWLFMFNSFPINLIIFSILFSVYGFSVFRQLYIDISNELKNKNLLKW